MSKLLKVIFIGLLLFTFSFVFSYATEEDNEPSTSNNDDIIDISNNNITKVSPINPYSQANLDLNNKLCIILISIGVVIILFAIAILIRLKR